MLAATKMDIMVPPKPLKPCDSKNHTTTSALDKKLILQGSAALFQPAKRFQLAIQELSILLEEIARNIACKLEHNRFCISDTLPEGLWHIRKKVKSVGDNYRPGDKTNYGMEQRSCSRIFT